VTLDARLRALVRDVPDFPKPGILFRDVTPLLADRSAFVESIAAIAAPFRDDRITHVAAIESRGFIFGAPLAIALGAGLLLVRKAGKLPAARWREEYALEYGSDALELHEDACGVAARVLVVDDVLATGGTARAACALVERGGATVAAVTVLIELSALGGRAAVGRRVESVLRY
jgi:adenine phosphoribosyltransferase